MQEHSPADEVYTPSEAVQYLREKRGIIFTVASLRNRRRHGTAKARKVLKNTSLWTKAELDAIEPSSHTKRVEKKNGGDNSSSVMLIRKALSHPLMSLAS